MVNSPCARIISAEIEISLWINAAKFDRAYRCCWIHFTTKFADVYNQLRADMAEGDFDAMIVSGVCCRTINVEKVEWVISSIANSSLC